jgi:hypothetical protein
MRGFAKTVVKLYPAHWRARYGEELEALVEDSGNSFSATLSLLTGALKMHLNLPSFPKLALMLGTAGILLGFGASFLVSPDYISSAVLAVEQNPEATGAPSSRRNLPEYTMALQNEILSRTSLSSIIHDPRLELYPRDLARYPLEDVIENMRKSLRIRAAGGAGVDVHNYWPFEITFDYADRVKAQQTVQTLITKLIDANLVRQRTPAYVIRHRTYDQIDRMEARIAMLEKRLGITSPPPESLDQPVMADAPIQIVVVDPPSLPAKPVSPNRAIFASFGFGGGVVIALLIVILRRKAPPIPFPAQTA